ncbi:MAG: type II toxin-antitoxin system VapC family toxin [Thalassobaculum sp.]|uniref:type II toxin-antitoxin system VapC family toxin n=1 Tax=Thalassobaculum sp. TaxID=2022740 RepID=UPI0032ECE619
MVKALFDTNVLVDFLNAVPEAREELGRYDEKAISVIIWIEVMVGADPDVEEATRRFLGTFTVVPLAGDVAERAIALRRKHRIKLPDAVIWASADARSMLLVTRNTKDFPAQTPGVRIPYTL